MKPHSPRQRQHEALSAEDDSKTLDRDEDLERVQHLRAAYQDLKREIARVVVGQEATVELLLNALFSGGHAILVGVPGLAKTLLVKTLSRLLSLSFKRIQFTPDLMPSDITGTEILQENSETGHRSFRFVRGPVFTQMLLADEINRTPPKTQAALLEAIEEGHVTVGDQTMQLPAPFFVVATQNPIEHEGTYQLPEAQLDRFLFSIEVPYPSAQDELKIMQRDNDPAAVPLEPQLSPEDVRSIQALAPRVPIAEHVCRFALDLVRWSRPEDPGAPPEVKEFVTWGAGPRAAKGLLRSAKTRALLEGRFHATTGDVAAVAPAVLVHRLVTNFSAESQGITPETIIQRLLDLAPRDTCRP